MDAQQRRNRFRANIKRLMKDRGLTPRQLAIECDLPLKWVKRACEGGLDRLYVRNKDKLTKLAAVLGLSDAGEFWRETPFTDLPTAIRDHWKELVGSPVEKIAQKELEACRDACRDLVRCRKVHDLIRQMPEGEELADLYLMEVTTKEERSFFKSVEDEADYQHRHLTQKRERHNLTSLLDRVRRMEGGEWVLENIQRDLDADETRWIVPYARGSRTMREYCIKAIDVLGEEATADWLYQHYSQITPEQEQLLQQFLAVLEAGDEEFAKRIRRQLEKKPESRLDALKGIDQFGVEVAAQKVLDFDTSHDLPSSDNESALKPASSKPNEDIVEKIKQEYAVEWPLFLERVHNGDSEAAEQYVRGKWEEALAKSGDKVTEEDFANVFYQSHLKQS